MKKLTLILLTFFIIIAGLEGCDTKHTTFFLNLPVKVSSSDRTFEIRGSLLPLSKEAMGVHWIDPSPDSLLMLHRDSRDALHCFYSVYTRSGRYVKEILRAGRGPGEFTIANICRYSRKGDTTFMYIADINLHKYFKIDLTETLAGNTTAVVESWPIPAYMIDVFATDEGHLAGTGLVKGKIGGVIYDLATQQTVEYPLFDCTLNDAYGEGMLAANKEIRPAGDKIVFTMVGLNEVNIWNLKEPQKSISVAPDNQIVSFDEAIATNRFQRKVYYYGAAVSDELIIALYTGGKMNDAEYSQSSTPMPLHVFDWDGNMLCKLKPDRKLSNLYLTDNHKLYGLDKEERIWVYDLAPVLKQL